MKNKIVEILRSYGITGDFEIDPGTEGPLLAALTQKNIKDIFIDEKGLQIEYYDPKEVAINELQELLEKIEDPEQKKQIESKIQELVDALVIYHEQHPQEKE